MQRPAPVDHPIHSLLRARWSPRAFAPEPLASGEAAALFEAARWAPSSYNAQPWAFLVAPREEEERFGRFVKLLRDVNQVWAQEASLLAFGCARLALEKTGDPNRHAFYDLGAAVMALCVEATSRGLFVHQMAGIYPERAAEDLGVPAGWEVVVGLAVGRYGDLEGLPEVFRERERAARSRKPQGEFVFGDRWGESAGLG